MAISKIVTNSVASGVTLTSPTIASPTISAPVLSGSVTGTYTLAGTPTTGASLITSGTVQATTSGTSKDFTGIPSWVKRVTVMLQGVSTNGSANVVLQVGAGSVLTSGYTGSNAVVQNSGATVINNNSTAFVITNTNNASDINHGHFVLTLVTSNTWVGSGVVNNTNSRANINGGSIAVGGTLDRVRITTSNGTDTFDAGSINILYE